MEITYSEHGVKGDTSSTTATKPAIVETGLKNYLTNYMGVWGNYDDVFSDVALIFAPWATYEKVYNGVLMERPIPFIYMIPSTILFSFPIWFGMSIPFINFKKSKG